MINVTIVGFGHVGSSLAVLLLNSKYQISLNIMDPNQECEGAFLDLAHSITLCRDKELHINNEKLFDSADFIYYAAGTRNVQGTSRLSIAKQNIALTEEVFKPRVFVNTPFIIVITNPVDIIAQSVYELTNLPAKHVFGTGTFLDSVRMAYYLSSISELNATDFEILVLGEHGDSQVPVYSSSKAKGLPLLNHPMFSKKELENTTVLTKKAASEIRETQEATIFGVSKCAAVLLDFFLDSEEHSLSLSMLTNKHYRSLLLLKENIYIGMPVIIKNREVLINNDLNINKGELNSYRKSAQILSENIKKFRINEKTKSA